MGSIGSSQPAISTLKELRKEYPELIKTSGATYHIDGMGWYKQRTTPFGRERHIIKIGMMTGPEQTLVI